MVRFVTALLALVGVVAVSAAPLEGETLAKKACVYECGSNCYSQSAIDAAVNKGYSLLESGDEAGDYPHQYKDYEGFSFPTSSPWYEFPILSSGKVYSGGSPGADRVIFDSDGNFDSVITHTGASGDDFVACQS